MTDWTLRQRPLGRGSVQAQVLLDGKAATFGQVMSAWQNDESFRVWFNDSLAAAPYAAFRWETPAVVDKNFDRPFEFVLLDSPGLSKRTDAQSFAEQFRRVKKGETVVTFANLGKNAVLVAPCPLEPGDCYAHLGDFVRYAPPEQRSELWKRVGAALAARLSDVPVWLSTAGAGVAWLHVRLDDTPKYYHHDPYRTPPVPPT